MAYVTIISKDNPDAWLVMDNKTHRCYWIAPVNVHESNWHFYVYDFHFTTENEYHG